MQLPLSPSVSLSLVTPSFQVRCGGGAEFRREVLSLMESLYLIPDLITWNEMIRSIAGELRREKGEAM